MKRYFSMSTLVLVTVIAGLLQLGCANPQPTNTSTNANMAVAEGTPGGKDQDLKDIESGALSADSWEVSEIAIKVLDKDSAIATVRSVVKSGKYKTPDGKTNDMSGEYRSVDT